ncbi:MAG: hypothetical protein EBW87_01390 [Burkholderiaceae bacterium]|nr:hypothetical protein [Burkholderiaceae bacterium]
MNVPKLRESGDVRRRCNLSHALKRAMERWQMSMEDVEEVESKITAYYTDCNAPFVKYIKSDSFHADRHIYSVEVRDLVVPVVWCETTKTVVTFLPPDFMNTVASEWIPATVRQCGEFIDAMGKELNRLAQEIAASKKGTLERDSLQATYKEKVVELNRLKLLRDTHYEVTWWTVEARRRWHERHDRLPVLRRQGLAVVLSGWLQRSHSRSVQDGRLRELDGVKK